MKILVINGVNLNMLGIREPEIYGKNSLKSLVKNIKSYAKERKVRVKTFQSNFEGEIVGAIQKAYGKYQGITFVRQQQWCAQPSNYRIRHGPDSVGILPNWTKTECKQISGRCE